MTTANEILTTAAGHLQDRAATYDRPEGERSMGATVAALKAVTGIAMTEEQGWLFMVLLKAVRTQQGRHRGDNYEDGAAYFALAGETAAIERLSPAEASAKLQEIATAKPARAEELQADEQGPACSCPGVVYRFLQDEEARHICAEKPIDDGWIEWGGGKCPVDVEVVVSVLLRDRGQEIVVEASSLRWEHSGPKNKYSATHDIIAYRIAKEQV